MKAAVRRGGRSGLVRDIVVAGFVGALLTGCSGNPAPAPLAEPPAHSGSPSPAPVRDPSPSVAGAPTMPAAAAGRGARAAKAFVRYYIATINQALDSGNTTVIKSLSSPSCDSCAAVTKRIRDVYSAGGEIKGRGWHVTTIQLLPHQPRTRPLVDVGLKLSPQVVVKRAGAVPAHYQGGRVPLTFHLARAPGGWVVRQWERSA